MRNKALLAVAFLLFMFALIVANGGKVLDVAWNVWLCGGLAALALNGLATE